jgi:cysteinyl-tRNA synthetase
MQSSGVHVAQCFEGGTIVCLIEELVHFATCGVAIVEICHVGNFRSYFVRAANASILLLEKHC